MKDQDNPNPIYRIAGPLVWFVSAWCSLCYSRISSALSPQIGMETYSVCLVSTPLQNLHNAVIDIVGPKLIIQAGITGAVEHALRSVSAVAISLAYGG